MTGLLGAGVALMIVADAVVGVRLVALAARTRRLPELGLGGALLGLGALGYPLAILARRGVAGPEATGSWIAAALGFQDLGCAAMAMATLATFRPGAPWARGLAAAVTGTLAASWVAQLAIGDLSVRPGGSAAYWVGLGARALPFVWSAAESWRYHGQLRRRLRIGLSDAVVADRFRLWAISASGVVAAFALFTLAVLLGADVGRTPWLLAATSAAGAVSGVTLWLAFLPPAGYLRRVAAAAPSGDDA